MPVLISWAGFLGVIPGADLGRFGAWVAMCADIWVRGPFFAIRFASGRWKRVEV